MEHLLNKTKELIKILDTYGREKYLWRAPGLFQRMFPAGILL
jgi:hypothetical protein